MNNEPYSGAVIIDSNAEEIQKLIKKYKDMEAKGKTLFKLGKSGLIITILSPFDIEGPLAEMITAVVAAVGFTMKTVAKAKLDELTNSDAETFTAKDNNELKSVVNNMFKFSK